MSANTIIRDLQRELDVAHTRGDSWKQKHGEVEARLRDVTAERGALIKDFAPLVAGQTWLGERRDGDDYVPACDIWEKARTTLRAALQGQQDAPGRTPDA